MSGGTMDHRKPSLAERGLDALAAALQRRHEPQSAWQRAKCWGCRLLLAANVAYAAGLLGLWALTGWVGERHYFTAFCLFAPPQLWLLPLLLLAPLTLLLRPRWLLLHAACALWVAFGFYDFHWNRPAPARGTVLRVITNNYGQNNRQSLTAFLDREQPDIVVLQEATGQTGRLLRAYTNFHGRAWGEFVVLSRHPVLNAGPAPVQNAHGVPVAAWFELSVQSRTLVVYNVHLPSPRRELYRLRGLGMAAALAGEAREETTRTGRHRREVAQAWRQRVDAAMRLAEHLEKEQRPFLVAGDFNMPSRGWLHRQYARRFSDAFAGAGRGWGLTFPGHSSNPLTGFGPWLRLDYVFAGPGLRPVYSQTERERKSQHRAVAARFEWME